MTKNPIVFSNGTKIANAKVEVDGTIYDVTPAQYEGTTPVNADNLNAMQNRLWDEIERVDNINEYSTSEKVIGKWINGKPLYRKVISFGSLPNSTTKNVAHEISNLGEVTRLSAIATNGSGSYKTIPDVISTNTATYMTSQVKLSISSGNIVIYTESNQSSFSTYVVMEYTKTSD